MARVLEESSETRIINSLLEFKVHNRDWVTTPGQQNVTDGSSFTIVTYNILGDKAIRDGTYTHIDAEYRYMPCRHPRIMKELETFNADIVCLQEVQLDHFHANVTPDLRKLGYNCEYHDRYDDLGLVTAFKSDKFELMDVKHCVLGHMAETAIQTSKLSSAERRRVREVIHAHPHAILLVKLKCLSTGVILTLGNIHTLWGELKKQDIQTVQIVGAVNEMVSFAGGIDKPHILVGDFNTPPYYPAYHFLKDGELTKQVADCLRSCDVTSEFNNGFLVDLLEGAFYHKSELKSAYFTSMGREPSITNLDDACQEGLFSGCLDYLWYNEDTIEAVAALDTPPDDIVHEGYCLPSHRFPSDHLPLQARFRFKV